MTPDFTDAQLKFIGRALIAAFFIGMLVQMSVTLALDALVDRLNKDKP